LQILGGVSYAIDVAYWKAAGSGDAWSIASAAAASPASANARSQPAAPRGPDRLQRLRPVRSQVLTSHRAAQRFASITIFFDEGYASHK
jgi:hypothetical protein